jgi:hypothetical protein
VSDIVLKRHWYSDRSTIGAFTFGDFFCFALEDRVRADGVKIFGETAVPAGCYRVVVDFSRRFQRRMPLLIDVPMFTGIRIHSGNTNKDTKGCILVGSSRAPDWVGDSRRTFAKLFLLIDSVGALWIQIVNEPLQDIRSKDESISGPDPEPVS